MPTPYTIAQNDTLSGLAAKNNTTVQAIQSLNPTITDPNKIYAGASLNLPDAPAATQLLPSSGAPAVATSDPVQNAALQAKNDQAQKDQEAQAELARLTTQKQIGDLKTAIAPAGGAPAAPGYVTQYQKLRADNGVPALEDEQASIGDQRRALQDQLTEFKASQNGLGRTQSFVDGADAVKGQQIQEQLDTLDRREALVVDKLNAKNQYIGTVMDLTKQDYETASAAYEKEFSQNLQLQNLYSDYQTKEDQQANAVRDDARAYLTSVQGMLKDSGQSFDALDPTMRAQIQTMELKAGIPAGSTEAFAKAFPDAKPLATVDGVDAAGNQTVSFIYKDSSGKPGIVQTVNTGAKKPVSATAGNPTRAEITADTYDQAVQEAASIFDADRQKNGDKKVSPDLYEEIRARVPAQYRDDFDKKFSNLLSDETKVRFGITTPGGRPR